MNEQQTINDLKRRLEKAERNFEMSKIIMGKLEVDHRNLKNNFESLLKLYNELEKSSATVENDYDALEYSFNHLVSAHDAVLEENIELKRLNEVLAETKLINEKKEKKQND